MVVPALLACIVVGLLGVSAAIWFRRRRHAAAAAAAAAHVDAANPILNQAYAVHATRNADGNDVMDAVNGAAGAAIPTRPPTVQLYPNPIYGGALSGGGGATVQLYPNPIYGGGTVGADVAASDANNFYDAGVPQRKDANNFYDAGVLEQTATKGTNNVNALGSSMAHVQQHNTVGGDGPVYAVPMEDSAYC